MSVENNEPMSLGQRQKKLETMIACPMGKGQVYIRNFIDPALRQKGAHLALRCKVREYLRMDEVILELEDIVMTCCRTPLESCEAYKMYTEKHAAG